MNAAIDEKSDLEDQFHQHKQKSAATLVETRTTMQAEIDQQRERMQADIDKSDDAASKATNSLKEVADAIAEAARNGPGLVQVAKATLSDKQARIDELEAALAKQSTEHSAYEQYYKGLDKTSQELKEYKKTTGELRSEVSEQKTQIINFEHQIEQLQKDLRSAEAAQTTAAATEASVTAKLSATVSEYEATVKKK